MEYSEFIKSKEFNQLLAGFEADSITKGLFDHQLVIVKWALRRGRAAIFADTGLGKTAMQLAWADAVVKHTGGKVLVVAPLCVGVQTEREAGNFGISATFSRVPIDSDITITNYEMLDRFDMSDYSGVVLDESSILKSHSGKMRSELISRCAVVPYRLSCTATPSPNDYMELANQAEFLGVMKSSEMLAMFFTHDGGDTAKWRLKGHGKLAFWKWMATWACVIKRPSDLGFSDDGYILPALRTFEHSVECKIEGGDLFGFNAQTLDERRHAKRESLDDRAEMTASIVNNSDEQWLVWCHLNDESDALERLISGSKAVSGSDSIDDKSKAMESFTNGSLRVLITKPSIAGFGMNWQHCHNMAFVGLDDSYESYYQAVRRCYRFGQKKEVNVHIITTESLGSIRRNIERKETQMIDMQEKMITHMRDIMKDEIFGSTREKTELVPQHMSGRGWDLHLNDCVQLAKSMPDNSVDFSIFSPPFASLYTYSNSDYDMGNCRTHSEFYAQFEYLVDELFRVIRPGRLVSFHCMNLPTSKQNDGFIGIRDFRGELVRMFVEHGFIFHSEVCIWKDPVTAMQRTKAIGLLHKQLKKDSALSRQGIPDYLVTMRKPGENTKPITNTNESFPVGQWQHYASPVWMDVNPSRTLQKESARDNDDERHICPLQLDVIERAMRLWTAPDDLVFSPFTGIGSEGFVALQMGRRFVGSELKPSYFNVAANNLKNAELVQSDIFGVVA